MSKNSLKNSLITGQIIDQAKLHEFIDDAHNEVDGVYSATATVQDQDNIQLHWVKTGNVYSFWINHIVSGASATQFRAHPFQGSPIAGYTFPVSLVPPLQNYQGDASLILMDYFTPTAAAGNGTRDLIAHIDENGVDIRNLSSSSLGIASDNIFVLNFIMVLG